MGITFLFFITFVHIADAHWVQTHQKMLSLTKGSLPHSYPYSKIHEFLDTVEQETNNTYLRFIMIGLKDADIRANGIYLFDCHEWNECWDWDLNKTNPNCYPTVNLSNSEPLCNNIASWPIGDHGYNPEDCNLGEFDCRGFHYYTAENKESELRTLQLTQPELIKNILDAVLPQATTEDEQWSRLRYLLESSNAAKMANEFYSRAVDEWKQGHFKDSMYNLGVAIHLVQDATVPYHTNFSKEFTISEIPLNYDSAHDYYEGYTWHEILDDGNFYKKYIIKQRAFDIRSCIESNAKQSIYYSPDPVVSAHESMQLGVQSTINVIFSFFKQIDLIKTSNPWLSMLLLEDKQDDSELSNGLVAYYPFAGNANDESGNSSDGTIYGAVLTEDRFGNPESAYYFDGIDDYIDIGNSLSLKPSLPVTISAWVKPERINKGTAIFLNNFTNNRYYGVWLRVRNVVGCAFGDGGKCDPASRRTKVGTTDIDTGIWYHVAGVIRGAQDMDLYVNGNHENGYYTGTGGQLAYDNNSGTIGKRDVNIYDPPNYFKGTIDEIRFYNRALSEQEIYHLYSLEK